MKTRFLLAATLLLSASACSALAAATPEEAARIKAAMETYLSATPGVVTVTPEGNAYAIKVDIAPFLAKVPDPNFKAYADPYTLKAEPLGNGQWNVTSTGTWGLQMSADKAVQITMRVAEQNWSGVYDENLAAFTKSSGTFNNISMSQVLPDPSGSANMSNIIYTIGSVTMDSTATPAGTGVDAVNNMVMSNIASSTTMTGPDGGTPPPEAAMMNYSVTSPKLTYSTTGKGLTYKPLMELVAWFVARPEKQLIINDQQQLKEKLQAALPLFQNVLGNMKYENLNVTTAFGQFGIGSLAADINMNGLVKDGYLQERFAISGFTMPQGLLPPWVQELVPNTVTVDFALKGFDFAAPAQLALGQLDLSKPEPLPPGFENILLPSFLPTNAVTIDLGASEVSNALYSVTYDGQITAALAGLPTGKANIRMKGLDAVVSKLQANGSDPQVQQALAGIVGMKGLGKAEPDGSMLWAVDATTPGKVLVNGLDVSAMLGMAQPPAQ
jgi:hypothetical protein